MLVRHNLDKVKVIASRRTPICWTIESVLQAKMRNSLFYVFLEVKVKYCFGRLSGIVKAVATPESALEFPLTAENIESVLDEVRPYLIADGGNVALQEIDGNVVRLKLQGACGSCPSSV
ncbi:hypothetical protein Leryth_013974 [Lithospermum erythrorhizon]|nr:hypothetical protein Leryth_013974 [Lithospermum erythrorhizon]